MIHKNTKNKNSDLTHFVSKKRAININMSNYSI